MKKCSSSGDYPLNHSESQDLPPYECRRSKRAQRLHIRVFPTGKVEVVLPQGCSKKRGQALVRERVDWIERALQKMASRKASIDTNFPLTLDFFAINETWEILRESDSHPTQIRLREKGRSLILSGATAQDTLCLNVLKKWLIQKGKKELVPWLDNVSHEVKLPYNKASVRGQKTRWGSCSSQKSISLNYKLLFLSSEQVRYLFIHELSHTRHMNHSKDFWALVEKLEPDYKRLDKSLRHAMRDQVSEWLSQ
jgi:predicted metal-dependent hydrolase